MQIKLDQRKKYLLACSYGPDSMVLFSLLKRGGFNFQVAHVNYMMREAESEEETKNLIAYCQAQNIICHTKYIDGKKIKGNFQEEARRARYEFFGELIESEKFDALLTAHHNDDHLETYLMQKESKRTPFYYGISSEIVIDDIFVIRPLLAYSKEEIIDYAKNNNVPYSIDSSNLKTNYTRNKLRHNVLKLMCKAEKNKLNAEINELNTQSPIDRFSYSSLIQNNTILISEFNNLPATKKQSVIYEFFLNFGIITSFSGPKAENIVKLINSKKQSLMQRIISDIYLVKFEGKIAFIDITDYETYKFELKEPKLLITKHFRAKFDDIASLPSIRLDQYPLTITTASKDDVYKIKNYEKKVSRLYIDMKLPRHYRLIWPVVKNKDGKIIYIPRYRSEFRPNLHSLFTIYLN